MTIAITTYTTYESIRVTLGLNSKELPDTLLAAEIYALALEEDLSKASDTFVVDYTAAALLSTEVAVNFVRAARIFSTYSVAFQCTGALPLFTTKAITDGKAGIYRDGNSPYKETVLKVTAGYDTAKRKLLEAYGLYSGTAVSSAVPYPMLGVSSPSTDPVTGA